MKFSLSAAVALALLVSFGASAWADPAGDTIYITTGGSAFATVDPDTGGGTSIGNAGYFGTFGCAFDTDGTLYATMNNGIYLGTVNISTGAVTLVGSTGANLAMYAIEIDANGTMYGLSTNGKLYTVNKTTGAATLVGSGSIFGTMDIAFDSDGTLWAVAGNRLYTIDTSDGTATLETAISGAGGVMSLQFDDDDTCYVMPYAYNAGLYTLNTTTGAATLVGSSGLNYPHGGDFFNQPDTDGDGIPDSEDDCINSDLSPTIVIDGCDTEVENILFDNGCTMADLLADCAADASNHGQYVSCVATLTNAWKSAGLITGQEKGSIQSCAAQSSLP